MYFRIRDCRVVRFSPSSGVLLTDRRVVAVACHPVQDVVAVGYENGLVLLVRIDDGAEIPVNKPGGAAASALAWNATGAMLAFGCEDGQAGILRL